MRDIRKVLEAMMEYRTNVGENPIEYTGYGEGKNLIDFLVQKFEISDKSSLDAIDTDGGFMDILYAVFDEEEEIGDYEPTEIRDVILSEIGIFDASEILVAEYLCSTFCSDESYEEYLASLEDTDDYDEEYASRREKAYV